jgi:FkbM family methyltransferase
VSVFTNTLSRFLVKKENSYGLDQLDLKLKPYLNFKNGFFVEAGANDGITQSNTLYFEEYRGWNGFLIEPVPELAAKCRINRPACVVENAALVPFSFKDTEIEMRYSNLMSLVKGAMRSEENDLEHIKKGCEIQNISTYEVKVPARTLTSLLDQHAVRQIDFLSLDVEGFELDVLEGIDFRRYRPTLMLIEARFRKEIDCFLEPLYEPVAELSHHDVLYQSRKLR